MDNFSIILDEMIGRMFFISSELEKKPKDYGKCGIPLHMSDIHMIETIQKNQNANTTEIARIMNTTKSTVSKITKRLEKKGMIKKYKFLDNKKEIYFKLTDLGLQAFNGHYKYHASRTQSFDKEFNSYTEEEKKLIVNFLKKYTEELEQYLE